MSEVSMRITTYPLNPLTHKITNDARAAIAANEAGEKL
jgi:hypothetical protein